MYELNEQSLLKAMIDIKRDFQLEGGEKKLFRHNVRVMPSKTYQFLIHAMVHFSYAKDEDEAWRILFFYKKNRARKDEYIFSLKCYPNWLKRLIRRCQLLYNLQQLK